MTAQRIAGETADEEAHGSAAGETATDTRYGPYKWVILGTALSALTTGSVVYSGTSVLTPFWLHDYHLTAATAGLASAAMHAGPIASMLLLGGAIDRYGERWVVSLTMIAMGVTSLAAATLHPDYPLLLLFILAMGAFYGSILPGGQKAIARWFEPSLQSMATGIRQAGLPLGASLAGIILPPLALHYGWSWAIAVQGIAGIAGGVVFAALYRKSGDRGRTQRRAPVNIRRLVAGLVADRIVRSLMTGGLVLVAFQYVISTQLLIFLSDHLKIPIVAAGLMYSVAQVAGIVGRIGLAWVSDHFWPGKRMRSLRWLLIGSAVPVAALAALGPHSPHWIVYALCLVLGLLSVGWYPLYLVQVTELAPRTAVASTLSFAITLNQIIASVAPPVFGYLCGAISYPVSWLLMGVLFILTAVQLRQVRTTAGQKEHTHAQAH
ncbi:MFS transporter [Streptomyces sp. IMTB 2501]|uniref:MFS transporter n=1 Tax=Streptomyces sp. IMTB 2501 TaxID=1776340 RepID=UPI0009A24F95|nr:MFS transporter [Streptomyces sp. IMTB 2501]